MQLLGTSAYAQGKKRAQVERESAAKVKSEFRVKKGP
jgi:hypothetical protein